MGKIINLADRLSKPPPQWGATVAIDVDGAELIGMWGEDGKDVSERCWTYATALRRLAERLEETAEATQEPRHER